MVRAVVFDVGGVLALVEEPPPWVARWEGRLGLEPGGLRDRVTSIWHRGRIGASTLEEIEAETSAALALTTDDARQLWDDLWQWYLGAPNTELIAYAAGLRPRYVTAVLSNSFVGAREREQERYRLGDLFDHVLYSHEEGMEKPDPRFYELLCHRLDVEPSDVIFIDDLAVNVDAARAAGMEAVRFVDTPSAVERIEALLR